MRELAAVVVGAVIGTALRLGLDTLLPKPSGFPLSTIIINVVGSFALAVLVVRVWPRAAPWLRAGLGTGLVGTFTTFSAFALSIAELSSDGEWGVAVLYGVLTLVLGLAAAFAGLALGRPRPRLDLEHE